MRIAEIFYSLQGEGKYTGVASIFIRTSGCNLRCQWCDTPYASWKPQGSERSVSEVVTEIQGQWPGVEHVVITGGEPYLQKDLADLVDCLRKQGKFVTIETAGTIFCSEVKPHFISLSPKLSHAAPSPDQNPVAAAIHQRNLDSSKFCKFVHCDGTDYQLKFVVSKAQDLDEVHHLVRDLGIPKSKVYLMAEGTTAEGLAAQRQVWMERCLEFGYGYTDRLHVHAWGNEPGR